MRAVTSALPRRGFLFAVLVAGGLALLPAAVFAQAFEVQASSGYVEALLPSLGWRQAVVGRQVPAGSVVTAWQDARMEMDYQGDSLTVGALSHVRIQALEPALVRLSLTSGSLTIKATTATFEVAFRGAAVQVEKGAATLTNGLLTAASG
ncbi:MAG TPA: hypothetical protein VMV03_12625, partial [Spirochaetia bacterium]|nr:hypothetical protein [Spirochaetia bacterium]